jgi:hypothetical protein
MHLGKSYSRIKIFVTTHCIQCVVNQAPCNDLNLYSVIIFLNFVYMVSLYILNLCKILRLLLPKIRPILRAKKILTLIYGMTLKIILWWRLIDKSNFFCYCPHFCRVYNNRSPLCQLPQYPYPPTLMGIRESLHIAGLRLQNYISYL